MTYATSPQNTEHLVIRIMRMVSKYTEMQLPLCQCTEQVDNDKGNNKTIINISRVIGQAYGRIIEIPSILHQVD